MKSEHGEIVLYQSEDGQTKLDVQLADETVWLTQKQIASLFETERSVITKHINNIFRSEELESQAVCANFAHTASDGKTGHGQRTGAEGGPGPADHEPADND